MIVTSREHHGQQRQIFVQSGEGTPRVHVGFASPGKPLILLSDAWNHAIRRLYSEVDPKVVADGVEQHLQEVFGKQPNKVVQAPGVEAEIAMSGGEDGEDDGDDEDLEA